MQFIKEPLFLTNEKWYYLDEDEGIYKLTKEGQKDKEVMKSYEGFYRQLNGTIIIE